MLTKLDQNPRPLLSTLCLCLALLATLSGCGDTYSRPKGVPVSGAVTLDGQPAKKGTITFAPRMASVGGVNASTGESATATIQDGKFAFTEIEGPPPGKADVKIILDNDAGFAMDDEAAVAKAVKSGTGKPFTKADVQLKDPQASTVEVIAGGPELKFEMITCTPASAPATRPGVENP